MVTEMVTGERYTRHTSTRKVGTRSTRDPTHADQSCLSVRMSVRRLPPLNSAASSPKTQTRLHFLPSRFTRRKHRVGPGASSEMEQGEPPGGAVETLVLNSDIKENNGPIQSPGPTNVQTQNQTADLVQTSVTSSCQSTVVSVSAVDLFKAQNLIEIPSETPGPSSVRVLTQEPNPEQRPDQEPEQKLEQKLGERLEQEPNQKPSLVQNNRDMSPDSLQIKPSSDQSPVQTPSQSIVVRVSAMALFQALAKNPGQNQIRPRILTPTKVQAPVSVPVLDSQLQTKNRDQHPDQESDQDPDLIPIPLPPEAVRPLSPSPIITPLKPSVPPRGFRLNGRLIPLLPGMDGVVVFLRSRPRGSQSGLTSLCVMDAPPTRKRRVPRINSMQAPPPKRRNPPPSKKVRPPRKRKASKSVPGTGAMVTPPPVPFVPLKPRPQECKVPTLLQKDVLVQPPPDCYRCHSHFRPAPELRGFVCLCSQDLSEGLASLRLKRKEDRLRIKLKKLNVLNQRLRATRPEGYSPAASKSPSSLLKPLGNSIHFLSKPRPPVSPGVMRPHLPASPAMTRPRPSVSPATTRPRPSVSPATRPRPSVSPATTRPRPSVSPATTRPRPSVSPATTRPRPFVGPGVLRPLPPQQGSSAGPSGGSIVGEASGLSVGGATGRLVIRLEDFYYGSSEGYVGEQKRLVMRHKCLNCPKHLRGNIRLMHHMIDHVSDLQELMCPYCLRQIVPLANLERHLQAVHGPNSSHSTVVCQICERVFETEIALLLHMKSTHKPGEMPYCCELCGFRSSFFSLLWTHFEEVHSNTLNFLCHFCLRVMKNHCAYQAHVARHQKNQIYNCYRCRLHFLTAKDRQDHLELLHGTRVKPDQLSGLRPGTVVTVRTFQEVSPEAPLILEEEQRRSTTVMKRRGKTCKKEAVESLGKLLDHLQSSSGSCVECLTPVQNFQNHFPALVRCSRCVFQTCCSRAYANHMINNHSSVNRKLLYPCVFTSCPRSGGLLECVTERGAEHRSLQLRTGDNELKKDDVCGCFSGCVAAGSHRCGP
uniref:C2H2-type domain-containing protein n=1 Tax=Knipowitschia caucasica TaxID=637954 RepID=A0AAV2K7R2_KNICA